MRGASFSVDCTGILTNSPAVSLLLHNIFLIVPVLFIAVVLISVLGVGGISCVEGFPFDEAVFKEGRRRALPAA